jgi:hypothetical protein
MTTLVERARASHRRNIPVAGKQTVTLARDGKTVEITDAVGYETTWEIMGGDGITTQVASMEWLLPQDQLILDGKQIEPRMNDEITAANGKRYEPMKLSPTRPAVEPHCGDEFWLVHSKLWVSS